MPDGWSYLQTNWSNNSQILGAKSPEGDLYIYSNWDEIYSLLKGQMGGALRQDFFGQYELRTIRRMIIERKIIVYNFNEK